MRRYFAGALLLVLLGQSSAAGLAGTTSPAQAADLAALASSMSPAIVKSKTHVQHSSANGPSIDPAATRSTVASAAFLRILPHPLARHTPLPPRSRPDYGSRKRYARLILKPRRAAKDEYAARPVDLVKLQHARLNSYGKSVASPLKVRQLSAPFRFGSTQGGGRPTVLSASTTGIWPWWTYQTRSIPGIGTAMVNLSTLNFLFLENDVDVPGGGVDLSFDRVYNSGSQHNATNDDGSTPSVFGNRWTNNLDAHLKWTQGTANTGTVSVYTGDGARDDYTCEIDILETCASNTPGIYDLLGTTDMQSGIACQFQWTKKNGVSYIFNAPYPGCGNGTGSQGRLIRIYGRNQNFYLNLAYSWTNNNDSNPENLAQITVTHEPDGSQLLLSFGYLQNTSITELATVARPDGETLEYYYNSNGELLDIDKPGNNAVLPGGESPPSKFLDQNPIVAGNLPETYDIVQPGLLLEVCGPRAAISIIKTNNNPTDGACVDFDYNNHQLSDWYTSGVLNPTPDDGVISAPLQSGPNQGWGTWGDTTFFNSTSCNPYSGVEMQDHYGHASIWCLNTSGSPVETSVQISSSSWLSTEQSWDSNNNLTSVTDARGNTTNLAYDSNGNVAEVSLPSQTTSIGSVRPTYLFDHDSYNNVTNYCDPANESAARNSWNPSPGPTPCSGSGASHYAKFEYYNFDGNEIYGCLNHTYTPSGYHRFVAYGGNCGNGLPTQITGDSYSQSDGTQRSPTQTFGYGTAGNMTQYNPGDPDSAIWQFAYSGDGMKRVTSVEDPDGVTAYRCYNLDGSVYYSESARQRALDGSSTCPTPTQLTGPTPPPPPTYASVYHYDADGDVATVRRLHNCPSNSGTCAAATPAPTTCNSVSVRAGTTCNFYDGLDRLVEVKLPYDSSVDLYVHPWITRYLYDLTGNPQTFDNQPSFSAYGNLFETEELLPNNAIVSLPASPSPGSINNPVYQPVKGFAYDALDRVITKYSANGSQPYTETLTWDTSPLKDGNVQGFLGTDCNGASPNQCQQFYYFPDGELEEFNSNTNGSSPERDYIYDPDGRPTSIAEAGYSNAQTYGYDTNGKLQSSMDAANNNGRATLTHNRYPDGLEQSLDVATANNVLNQMGLFTYSYRTDGPLQTEVVNDGSLGTAIKHSGKTTLSYTYSDAGRLASRAESGAAAYPSAAPQTTIAYATNPPTGLVKQEVSPVTTLSNFQYTAESELTSLNDANCTVNCIQPYYNYSLRGELVGPSGGLGGRPFTANGVSMRAPLFGLTSQYSWNDLLAVLTYISSGQSDCGGGSQSCTSSWSYDQAGRMTSEVGPYPPPIAPSPSPPPQNTTTTRTYDAENHLLLTTFQYGQQNTSWENEHISWGPDGHPITIGTYVGTNSGSENDERLHWNGDQLLFTTYQHNGAATLDDIKVDVQGDVLVGDGGYSGLTFYDRGPGGTITGCHNITGTSYVGVTNSWGTFPSSPCQSNKSNQAKMPTSGVWGANPYWYNFNYQNEIVGTGATLTMPRTDGINDGFDTIQGVRTYNNAQGYWTTPDAYAGSLFNAASLSSYLWNGNNPVNNVDPSGYDNGPNGQPSTSTSMPTDTGCPPVCFTPATPPPTPQPASMPEGPIPSNFGFFDVVPGGMSFYPALAAGPRQAPGASYCTSGRYGCQSYPGCLACMPTAGGGIIPFPTPTPDNHLEPHPFLPGPPRDPGQAEGSPVIIENPNGEIFIRIPIGEII